MASSRWLRVVLAVSLLAGACNGDGGVWPPEGTGEESPPILVLASNCYGACWWRLGPGASRLAVYGDGAFIVTEVDFETFGDRSGIAITLERGRFDTESLDQIHGWAVEAGLVGGEGGLVGTRGGFADGGGSVFATRFGGDLVVVEAPHLYGDALDEEETQEEAVRPRRSALFELRTGALQLADDMGPEPVHVTAYVVFALERVGPAFDIENRGLDVRSFDDGPPGTRCTIVPAGDEAVAELATWSTGAAVRASKGVWRMMARPAYPHEQACSDVDGYRVGG